jgi:hypothetical protein
MWSEYGSWFITIFVPLLSFVYWRKWRRKQDDPFDISPCPNPNCIRCRKYAAVHAAAQDRLAEMHNPPKRLVQALQYGRRGEGARSNDGVSPAVGQYPTVLLIPGLAARPVVTDMHATCCDTLEKHTNIILQEYLEANAYASWLENNVIQNDDSSSAHWNVLHLLSQGVWNEGNAALCPETTRIVKSLDNLIQDCIFGNVFLSVLTPGSSIEPHCGPTNARHRLHLALQIPTTENGNDQPVLTVLNMRMTWKQEQAFVFDDSLTHAVDYPRDGTRIFNKPRVVFIVDLWHPDLTRVERQAIQELYPTI